jgi:hypothetical protein
MRLLTFIAAGMVVLGSTTAQAMTQDEIRAKLKSAGYSQIREVPSGKIKTLKAVKDGQERSIIVDSSGHFKEFQ